MKKFKNPNTVVLLATLIIAILSFFATAGITWVVCWAFHWTYTWGIAIAVWLLWLVLHGVMRR